MFARCWVYSGCRKTFLSLAETQQRSVNYHFVNKKISTTNVFKVYLKNHNLPRWVSNHFVHICLKRSYSHQFSKYFWRKKSQSGRGQSATIPFWKNSRHFFYSRSGQGRKATLFCNLPKTEPRTRSFGQPLLLCFTCGFTSLQEI